MLKILMAAVVAATAPGFVWAQEGGEKKKEAPKVQAEKREGDKKDGEGVVGADGALTLDQVDVNGDGKITRAELEAALKKMGGAGRKDGEGAKKEGPRDGEGVKKEGAKDGEGAKKVGPKDGEAAKKGAPREGDGAKKEGAKKEGDK